jgi:microcystin-dependent protein
MATFYVGQIITGGWNFAPRQTALCNGQTVAISQNSALFAILGTTYGGNGQTTFQLPNLQSRRMLHQGQGPGLSLYDLGQQAGVETTTLTINNLPSHTHQMAATFSAGGVQPKASTLAPAAGSVLGHATDISNNPTQAQPAIYCPSGTATPIALGGLNVSAGLSGNGLPFASLTPYLTINMVITLFGVFPSRN